jgi:putative membrane-bound dehydrogenase-like protein
MTQPKMRKSRRCFLLAHVVAAIGTVVSGLVVASSGSEPQPAPRAIPPMYAYQGFVVELVAAPPLVEHPTMAGFDERGRLLVADNAGVNFPSEELLEKLPNCLRMLEDTDGDGRFDKSTVFADKMTFPMGALAHQGAVYVASPPFIWRLEDTDGDGVADRRDQIVGKFGFVGNAADIHGCFLGPEGRIYWTDGRHGHNFVDSQGKTLSQGLAARIFSCRPDGSDVQVHCGGGMDNPVEVCFTDVGEMIGTMTFYNPDKQRHDALMHFVHGGVYPRKHACTSEFKRTGELMPALSLFDVVAPSGVMCYRGPQFGALYLGNVFSTQFNTHKVVRHVLSRDGATFRSVDFDFLTSSSPDFHPTDVLEDADGSLLVIDTGGWFRIGCPTSQVAKPEIKGGIYRVRRADAPHADDPRGLKMAWTDVTSGELAARLNDPRPAVRDRAVEALAQRGDSATPALAAVLSGPSRTKQSQAVARRNAVWTLVRIDARGARAALRDALADPDESVRQAAAYCAGTVKDADAIGRLKRILLNDPPHLKRDAAMALGRIGRAEAVPALLESLANANDRFLEHALIYALIEIDDRAATLPGLAVPNPDVRRAALIALDQMDSGNLTRELVAPLLDTNDVVLQRTAIDVISRRKGWADEITGLLGKWLSEATLPAERAAMLRGALLAFSNTPRVQALVADSLADANTSLPARLLLLETIARAELKKLPARWADQIERSLTSTDAQELRAAVIAAAAWKTDRFDRRLAVLGRDAARSTELRVAALAAVAGRAAPLDDVNVAMLIGQLGPDVLAMQRIAAADALGNSALSPRQREQLLAPVATAGPLELPALLRAFSQAHDAATGKALLAALAKAPGLASLSSARLTAALAGFPDDVRTAAQPLVAKLDAGLVEQRARLAKLKPQLAGGDAAAGKEVFLSRKAACTTCHRTGEQGGRVGPDLSKVGAIRTADDLAESILMPSASLARGYESYAVTTQSGQVHTGLLSRETATAIYLQTAERAEIRVDRSEIDQMAPSNVSIMPQGLDKLLSTDELRNLIAYLKSLQ